MFLKETNLLTHFNINGKIRMKTFDDEIFNRCTHVLISIKKIVHGREYPLKQYYIYNQKAFECLTKQH